MLKQKKWLQYVFICLIIGILFHHYYYIGEPFLTFNSPNGQNSIIIRDNCTGLRNYHTIYIFTKRQNNLFRKKLLTASVANNEYPDLCKNNFIINWTNDNNATLHIKQFSGIKLQGVTVINITFNRNITYIKRYEHK